MARSKKKRDKLKRNITREHKNYFITLILRYTFVLLISINSMAILSNILTPLTFYPALFIIKLFYNATGNLADALIVISNNAIWHSISIAEACVATSAYFLLLALNLTTRGILWKKRIKIFLFGAFSFLAVNLLRIFILAIMVVSSSELFDSAHFIFWHILSTVIVIVIWLFSIKIYNIKEIPLISDLKILREYSKKEIRYYFNKQ